jgi:hypothetical protein
MDFDGLAGSPRVLCLPPRLVDAGLATSGHRDPTRRYSVASASLGCAGTSHENTSAPRDGAERLCSQEPGDVRGADAGEWRPPWAIRRAPVTATPTGRPRAGGCGPNVRSHRSLCCRPRRCGARRRRWRRMRGRPRWRSRATSGTRLPPRRPSRTAPTSAGIRFATRRSIAGWLRCGVAVIPAAQKQLQKQVALSSVLVSVVRQHRRAQHATSTSLLNVRAAGLEPARG